MIQIISSDICQDFEEDTIKEIKIDIDKVLFDNTIQEGTEFETTICSKAIFNYAVPKVNNLSSYFQYNFFIENERRSSNHLHQVLRAAVVDLEDKSFINRTDRMARYAMIKWNLPEEANITPDSNALLRFKNYLNSSNSALNNILNNNKQVGQIGRAHV